MIPEARDQIILDLIEGGFLNEERFARSYTRGKFRIKKWGRVRISRELRKRGVSKKNIQLGLSEISEEDYIKTFYELVEKRLDEIHENSQQKRKRKIFDYLGYRGYEYPMIYEVLRELS